MKRYYYFAYGSNMACGQMGERCPAAEIIGPARLPGYRLEFTRLSEHWQCGVADAVAFRGAEIWGVLYLITEDDLRRLDAYEGYRGEGKPNAYVRRTCTVFTPAADGERRHDDVVIYFVAKPQFLADGRTGAFKPGPIYKKLMVCASRNHGVPESYVRKLEDIELQ